MKLSVLAMSSTSGPTTMPSSSSTTTTGGAKRRGTVATVTAASAAITTMTKKDSVSTWITWRRSYVCPQPERVEISPGTKNSVIACRAQSNE